MTTTTMTTDTIENIDTALAKIERQKAPILAAIEKADDLNSPPAPTTSDADAVRRRSIVDWLLGRADRALVDKATAAAEREAERLTAYRVAAERERDLVRLGCEELRKLLAPLDTEAERLRARRAALVAAVLNDETRTAAVAYREAMIAAGRAYARLCAIGERTMETGGSRHLFPTFSQIVGPAPSEGSEEVFGNALGGFSVYIIKRGPGEPPRGAQEAVVRVDDARRAVAAELAERGLTDR